MTNTNDDVVAQLLLIVLVLGFIAVTFLAVTGPQSTLTPAVILGYLGFALALMGKFEVVVEAISAWRG